MLRKLKAEMNQEEKSLTEQCKKEEILIKRIVQSVKG